MRGLKLFGLGAAVALLAVAAGNQVDAQIGIGGLLGFYWEGTRNVYYVASGLNGIPSVFIEVTTDNNSGNVLVMYWNGSSWTNVGDIVSPNSTWARRPSSGGVTVDNLRMVGNNSFGRFRIGVDGQWPNRPNTADAFQFRLSNGRGHCDQYRLVYGENRPNLAFLVGVRHYGGRGIIELPDGVMVPAGQGYIFAAPAGKMITVCANEKYVIVGEIVLKPYWSNQ